MNPNKRLWMMAAVFGLLILANIYSRWSDGGLEGGMFWLDQANLGAAYTDKDQKTIAEIRALPALSFRQAKPELDVREDQRNPFLFGIDRREETLQRERLVALETARAAASPIEATPEPLVTPAEAPPGFEGQVLGLMEDQAQGERLLAILLDGEIHVLRVGDQLAQRYRLLEIGYQRVRFLHLDRQAEIQVELE